MTVVLTHLTLLDALALGVFLLCVHGATALIERSERRRQSLTRLMARRRLRWMQVMAERDVRIVDSALLAIQHQGASFFASAAMIAIGFVAAVIANTDQLLLVARDMAAEAEPSHRPIWEMKLLFLLGVLVVAFLKFAWSHRLFGYCAILIGATPPLCGAGEVDVRAHDRAAAAEQAGQMNIRAGRSFNRGLRLLYFALAALAWLLGPLAFAAATLAVSAMLYRREFLSETRDVIAEG